jgi:hypothetical protein
MKILPPVEIQATCLESYQSYDVSKCDIQITGLPLNIESFLFKWLLMYAQCLTVNYEDDEVLLSDAIQEHNPLNICPTYEEVLKGLKNLPDDVTLCYSSIEFFESGDAYERTDLEVWHPDCEEDRQRLFNEYFDKDGGLKPDILLLNN